MKKTKKKKDTKKIVRKSQVLTSGQPHSRSVSIDLNARRLARWNPTSRKGIDTDLQV
jgi:hypothetical protein